MHRVIASLLLVYATLAIALQSAWAITIPTVPVGNINNANDPATGYGGVNYAYRIGTTEVTVGQYTSFLNSIAATDTYALYNTSMATDLNIAGISRSGVSGSYSYSVIGSANKPVTYVTWGDAARFSNWLHNGQPTGLQDGSTTENGAYPLNGATTNAALIAVSRDAGAKWFIPTENEWYKAAYHQPATQGGNGDHYWSYPTRNNITPYSDQPPGSGAPVQLNTANFRSNDELANGYNDGYAVTGSASYSSSQNYLTDAGAYASSLSPYGTFDQGGNVWEWNETSISGSFRGLRGGSWNTTLESTSLLASFRASGWPSSEEYNFLIETGINGVGFRVASVANVPEPGSAVLAIVACGVILWWRKRPL